MDRDLYRHLPYEAELYYRKMEREFCRKPRMDRVAEVFPEEIKELVPRMLERVNKECSFYLKNIKRVESNFKLPTFDRWFLSEVWKAMMPKKLIERRSNLRALSRLNNQSNRNISERDIEKAKMTDISGLYAFERLRRKARGFTASCPFHDDRTPSFSVRDNKFKCFSCGEYGDAIDFVMQLNHVPFNKALDILLHL